MIESRCVKLDVRPLLGKNNVLGSVTLFDIAFTKLSSDLELFGLTTEH
jgi:hypothetical protein